MERFIVFSLDCGVGRVPYAVFVASGADASPVGPWKLDEI
jgi:hypothetical protein